MSQRSIRKKIFFLFMVMGLTPFLIAVIYGAFKMNEALEEAAMNDSWQRNLIVDDHLDQLWEKNFLTLKAVANAPIIKDYVQSPTPEKTALLNRLLTETNATFNDHNLLVITQANGQQLIRTDNAPLVNVTQREHFQQAMKGHTFVSDVIQSMSTGELIVVLEAPIVSDAGQPIGMIQRNFNLSVIQEFLQRHADRETSVLILDRDDKILAHSDLNLLSQEDRELASGYEEITAALGKVYGVHRLEVNGEDTIVSFSRDSVTGWGIITLHPYHYIWDKANEDIMIRAVLGLLILIFLGTCSYVLAGRATKPIRTIANMAMRIANGQESMEQLQHYSDDEVGQLAHAISELQSARAVLQQEAERDPLTKLANRNAIEAYFRRKLLEYDKSPHPGQVAIFLIDLDHFHSVNDVGGHQQGDRILKEFAKILKRLTGSGDCVGRYDGDQFVVILDEHTDIATIEQKAQIICEGAKQITVAGEGTNMTASIGIAIAPQHGKTYSLLFHAADQALYYVKNHGRNGYHIASEDDEKPPSIAKQ
ncbi:MAG: diguanylate cyclase [Selenomonadaceae bacterium]|nr:diguanylate cyclase [Selenomonadaceae bacterium]